MAKNLCSRCFHSYVCEQFNEHRDSAAEYTRCHFYNDHFVDAADVEVVKHGRWEPWHPQIALHEYSFDTKECSECGYAMHNALRIPAYYCPNCGCKMDLEVANGLDQH